jgi:hypothetical protein
MILSFIKLDDWSRKVFLNWKPIYRNAQTARKDYASASHCNYRMPTEQRENNNAVLEERMLYMACGLLVVAAIICWRITLRVRKRMNRRHPRSG